MDFLDSSVLVPVFLGDHIHHDASLALFLDSEKSKSSCAAHSLAEVYSTVTKKYAINGDYALRFLKQIRERLMLVALDEREFYQAIEEAAIRGITGGAIYDALIARCAVKVEAEVIYTWNVSHFVRLGPNIAKRVKKPG
jgi:predicted nucleic acid-binding protein